MRARIAYTCGMRPARLLGLAAVSLAVIATSCKSASGREDSDREAPPPQARTTIRVENQRFQDMDIYVVQEGQRIRLGTVTGNSTEIFELPRSVVTGVTQLEFLAVPLAGAEEPVSEAVTVRPGDELGLTIAPY
jgi:hypothetical protein